MRALLTLLVLFLFVACGGGSSKDDSSKDTAVSGDLLDAQVTTDTAKTDLPNQDLGPPDLGGEDLKDQQGPDQSSDANDSVAPQCTEDNRGFTVDNVASLAPELTLAANYKSDYSALQLCTATANGNYEDWFKFKPAEDGDYLISVGYSPAGTCFDIAVFSALTQDGLLKQELDSAGTGAHSLTVTLSANTVYYVRVNGWDGTAGCANAENPRSGGPYSLLIEKAPFVCQDDNRGVKQGDDPKILTVNDGNVITNLQLCATDDLDWFLVDIDDSELTLKVDHSDNPEARVVVALFDNWKNAALVSATTPDNSGIVTLSSGELKAGKYWVGVQSTKGPASYILSLNGLPICIGLSPPGKTSCDSVADRVTLSAANLGEALSSCAFSSFGDIDKTTCCLSASINLSKGCATCYSKLGLDCAQNHCSSECTTADLACELCLNKNCVADFESCSKASCGNKWTDRFLGEECDDGNNIDDDTCSNSCRCNPQFLKKFGTKGSDPGQLDAPSDIALDRLGNIWVTDAKNKRIEKFSPTGTHLSTFDGVGNGDFGAPSGIAFSPDGGMVVTDGGKHQVLLYDKDGKFVKSWGAEGTANGQFRTPTAVVVDKQGSIYVADYFNARVQKFDKDGNYLLSIGSKGSGDGQLGLTPNIAIGPNGNLFVADTSNNRVQKFSPQGVFLAKWGTQGTGVGQFKFPETIAVDRFGVITVGDQSWRVQRFDQQGNFTVVAVAGTGDGQISRTGGIAVTYGGTIIVTDTDASRIQMFTPCKCNPVEVHKFGSKGDGPGQFSGSPKPGMALDKQGNLYVVDSHGHRVLKFDSSGKFVTSWGSLGTADGQFTNPRLIAVGKDGNVYVGESNGFVDHARIQKFDPSGKFLLKWGSWGTADGQFDNPRGLVVQPGGNLVVIDFGGRMQQFDPSGKHLNSWVSGTGNLVEDVAIDSNGHLYVLHGLVLNSNTSVVNKFDGSGNLLASWSGPTVARGIAVDHKGLVYVTVPETAGKLLVYDSWGNQLNSWSTTMWPVMVSPGGLIYQFDGELGEIKLFSCGP